MAAMDGSGSNVHEEPVVWQLTRLFRDKPSPKSVPELETESRFCLVVLNQPLHHPAILRRLWDNSLLRVAADGGANCLYEAGAAHGDSSFDNLDVVLGDLDSLRDDVREYFESRSPPTQVIHDPDQYSTDFTKAVKYVRHSQPSTVDIIALGGLGGRVDQGVSQLHHLYLFQKGPRYTDGRMYLVSDESMTFLLKAGKHHIHVGDGDEALFGRHVGILPIKEPSCITTKGLEWDVKNWKTQFGGQISTSNHILPETQAVEVETTKDVLFTIAMKRQL